MINSSHHFHDVESISVFVDPSLREGEETMTIEVQDKAGQELRTVVLFFNGKAIARGATIGAVKEDLQ